MTEGIAPTSDVLSAGSRRAKERREQPHFVYQIWSGRVCLYIGVTSNLGQRLTAHAKKDWWPEVRRVVAEIYPGKYEAMAVERDLIQELDPWVNRQCVL